MGVGFMDYPRDPRKRLKYKAKRIHWTHEMKTMLISSV